MLRKLLLLGITFMLITFNSQVAYCNEYDDVLNVDEFNTILDNFGEDFEAIKNTNIGGLDFVVSDENDTYIQYQTNVMLEDMEGNLNLNYFKENGQLYRVMFVSESASSDETISFMKMILGDDYSTNTSTGKNDIYEWETDYRISNVLYNNLNKTASILFVYYDEIGKGIKKDVGEKSIDYVEDHDKEVKAYWELYDNLKNPESLEIVGMKKRSYGDIVIKYRGTNSFGAVVTEYALYSDGHINASSETIDHIAESYYNSSNSTEIDWEDVVRYSKSENCKYPEIEE